MAVYNDYIDTQILNGRPTSAIASQGSHLVTGRVKFVTPVCDAGSVLRVLKGIPSTAVFKDLNIYTDGVTGANDVDVCLYKPMTPNSGVPGAEIGSELLSSTNDLSSAVTRANAKDGLSNITRANSDKSLWEIASQTINNRDMFMDIGLRSVNAITEADEIVVDYAYWAP